MDFTSLLSSAGDWLGNSWDSLLGGPELTSVNQFMPADIQTRAGAPTSPVNPYAIGNLGMSLLNQAQPSYQPMSMGSAPSAGMSRGSYTPLENFLKLWHSKGQTYGY